MHEDAADVCLIVEGAYPFVAGGVSSWVHDLLLAQRDLSFAIVAITPDATQRRRLYDLPPNVRRFETLALHSLPAGDPPAGALAQLTSALAPALTRFFETGGLSPLLDLLRVLGPMRGRAGQAALLNSESAYAAIEAMYRAQAPGASFLDYFWSWRALAGALFATLLAPLPPARAYHAISTGYAGLLAARGRIETGRPAILTEHGIYTNERRIEIALARWLNDRDVTHLGLDSDTGSLKALWMQAFVAYARAAYGAAHMVLTLHRGNLALQLADGAARERLAIVPNGVDVARFAAAASRRPATRSAPKVALIGRVVPIKDVKTFLRAVSILRQDVPDVQALVIGPLEEDAPYAEECRHLATDLGLGEAVIFTGRMTIEDALPHLDVVVLTSLSEAQPLVVLEAGAAGIPAVATDVGACRDMILGAPGEEPAFGPGGAVVPPANPTATARALAELLTDDARRAAAGAAMKARVAALYDKRRIDATYAALYARLIAEPAASAASFATALGNGAA